MGPVDAVCVNLLLPGCVGRSVRNSVSSPSGEKGHSTVDTEKHDIAWVLETRGHLPPNDLRDELKAGLFTTVPREQIGRLISFIDARRLPAGLTKDERAAYRTWVQTKVGNKELSPITLRLFD
jgi:hypothetical protein